MRLAERGDDGGGVLDAGQWLDSWWRYQLSAARGFGKLFQGTRLPRGVVSALGAHAVQQSLAGNSRLVPRRSG